MLDRFKKRRPSHSTVVAYLALFFALGGGAAYAAAQIGSEDIQNRAVLSRHIDNGQVKRADIRRNAVNGSRVGRDSLTGREIRESTLGEVPTAADAELLDGLGPGDFLRAGGKAADSDLLDGADSGDFLQDGDGAGGDLAGSYPAPTLAPGSVDAESLAALPHARATQTSAQVVQSMFFTIVDLDTQEFGSGVSFSDAQDSVTVDRAGVYSITGEVEWESNTTGSRFLAVASNRQGGLAADTRAPSTNGDTLQTVTTLAELPAGDSVSMNVSHNAGDDLSTRVVSGQSAALNIHWVGPAAP